ncbi:hypothetical protein P3T73_15210 [Kiritimatiellota bacterium B12222]|nr:hypothetical protein P3T73_15210 [Kiritimatiellota bacterium B12222]
MKKVLHAIGGAIDRLTGFLGGVILAVLISCVMSTAIRLIDFDVPGLGWCYLVMMIVFPLWGRKRHQYFSLFLAPIFNMLGSDADGGGEDMGPSTVDRWQDVVINIAYVLSVVLIFISFVFTAKTPLIIGTVLLLLYGGYVGRLQTEEL